MDRRGAGGAGTTLPELPIIVAPGAAPLPETDARPGGGLGPPPVGVVAGD